MFYAAEPWRVVCRLLCRVISIKTLGHHSLDRRGTRCFPSAAEGTEEATCGFVPPSRSEGASPRCTTQPLLFLFSPPRLFSGAELCVTTPPAPARLGPGFVLLFLSGCVSRVEVVSGRRCVAGLESRPTQLDSLPNSSHVECLHCHVHSCTSSRGRNVDSMCILNAACTYEHAAASST